MNKRKQKYPRLTQKRLNGLTFLYGFCAGYIFQDLEPGHFGRKKYEEIRAGLEWLGQVTAMIEEEPHE